MPADGPKPTGAAGWRNDVALAPLTLDRAADMLRWVQDPEIAGNLELRSEPSLEKTIQWIKAALAGSTCRPFAILHRGCHVGNVVLDEIDLRLRAARLSIYLGEPGSRGAGVGRTAVYLAARRAFGELELNRVWLRVHGRNEGAIRAYAGVGFQVEGTLRDSFLLKGEYLPAISMGLLRRDFEARWGRGGAG
jgi:RimJ/RimL family protein N-acetyltransferase